jgi:hypothetical protein
MKIGDITCLFELSYLGLSIGIRLVRLIGKTYDNKLCQFS